ncbi:uroporphyrinogen-III C-methyltransferase [Verrucomicrobia bacterium]|jgi:uroporphyrinogen III methyltransferase / synthase|nr:uroporphyrinogen-III C-methyltransferase [Verrucomicrobiota bacterium]MDA7866427.1 uroporphyrinogen-III C-methyltransferase [Verrucomicrobiota bacterium]
MAEETGYVYLVGAGPGDSGLLTMRGGELLGRADVVVYDALVNPDLLRLAPRDAEFLYGGKRAKAHAIPQAELNQLLVDKAKEGKTVVRLKGGDPYVFGRGGEEAEELHEAGVPFEVIPGVTSIIAATNYAGIPITHRDICSGFTVVTGHEDPTKESSSIDWEALAKIAGTKVILMGVERIGSIMDSLVKHGVEGGTPVGMVRWGTTGRQETLIGTVSDIAEKVVEQGFKAPAVTVVGDVVDLRDRLNWFEKRALFGQRVVVTRTRTQASQLARRLLEFGADVLEIPTIKIGPPKRREILIEAMAALGEYDWLVFTSPNGVTAFFDYFFRAFSDMRDLGNVRIAAVGPATAAKIVELHLKVDVMPKKYLASEVAAAIHAYENVENLKLMLARAEVANPELPDELIALGGIVDDVPVYETLVEDQDFNGSAARLVEEGADWITFTSSSTVEHFDARFDLAALCEKYPDLKFASIGPETSKALRALGKEPTIEASEHSIDGLVDILVAEGSAK